ncbi:MAG: hypothetical protein PHS14_14235 [Elusimicrobia bacterium]|nr:hypothetical protein [Elusimicrobiota bacterium]
MVATAVSTAATVAQTIHTVNTSKVNAKREEELAGLRAKERRDELRKTLAAQRVALIGQGRDPDLGTSLTLQTEAYKAAGRESSLDRFQTDASIQNAKNEGTGAMLNGLGRTLATWEDYAVKKREGSLGRPTGGVR